MQVSSQLRPSVRTAAHVVRAHLNQARRIGCSSFALFLDISHAFYRVIRQCACGADFSDEHLGKFLQRMGIHDVHLSDIAQMLEEGPSLELLGCRPFLHRHVNEFHEGTWFKLSQDHELVHTERGTRPGDGYADVIWALVFSPWIKQLQQRLTDSEAFPPRMWNGHIGICSDIGSQAVPHSLVVWADDVVILGQDDDPNNIVHKLRFACNTMVEELQKNGLQPNFQDGKTEAIIDPRGPRSTRVRRFYSMIGNADYHYMQKPMSTQTSNWWRNTNILEGSFHTEHDYVRRSPIEQDKDTLLSPTTRPRSTRIRTLTFPQDRWFSRLRHSLRCNMGQEPGPI